MKYSTHHHQPGEADPLNEHSGKEERAVCEYPKGTWPLLGVPVWALRLAVWAGMREQWKHEAMREILARKTEGEFKRIRGLQRSIWMRLWWRLYGPVYRLVTGVAKGNTWLSR